MRPADLAITPALAVAALTVLGIVPRLVVAQESISADELSTYWIVSTNGLAGVIETVHSDAEITPPLSFVATWVTTRFGLGPELLRLPSLQAGIGTIPLVYLLGLRTLGVRAGVVAAALTAVSPFMIYYSAEARGYAIMVALVLLSTLALLAAADDGRRRWWVVYAAVSCAAVYTHYTAVFALAAQLLWALWAHPAQRRAALLANAGAALAFLPWLSGLLADLESPTTRILAALGPFTFENAIEALEHWAIGYPYEIVPLDSLPGTAALVLIAVGVGVALVGAAARLLRENRARRPPSPGLVLILALALAAPVGEALASAVSTDVFGTRNLAVSWPAAALALAALLCAGAAVLRVVAAVLVGAGLGVGAVKMLDPTYQRPDFETAAEVIEREASPSTAVIDAAPLTPGPLTPLDVVLDEPPPVVRAGVPQQRTHPFAITDPIPTVAAVIDDAMAGTPDELVVLNATVSGCADCGETGAIVVRRLPDGFRQVAATTVEGTAELSVLVFERRPAQADGGP